MNDEQLKKVVEYLFAQFIRDLEEVNSPERPFRDHETIDDLIDSYTHWDLDQLIKALKVNVR